MPCPSPLMYGDIEDLSAHENLDTINLLAHNREQEKKTMMSSPPNPNPPPSSRAGRSRPRQQKINFRKGSI